MTPHPEGNELLAAVEQLTSLVAIAMTRGMRNVEAIDLLGRSSLSSGQIAAIVGTSPDSVRAQRSRLKRSAKKPTKKGSGNGSGE